MLHILLCSSVVVAGLAGNPASDDDQSPWWSLRTPTRPAVPDVKGHPGPLHPIDAFVLEKLKEKGLSRAPLADKRTLVRRASFDLLGLPPAPDRVEAFVKNHSPDAYEELIDELLDSPHYGERWGRHWLDLTRYADTGGYETDMYYRTAWRYRDYVVKSLNDDKPYDRFVQEQIAGDELWPDELDLHGSYNIPDEELEHLEARLGTGLFAVGPRVHESNLDADKARYETLTDWVDTTAAAFMASTLGCSRCHDHKFDPFTQTDYFGFQAIFAASKEVEVPLSDPMGLADFKEFYPRVEAVVELRRAYHLLKKDVGERPMTPQEKAEEKRLLESIGRAVVSFVGSDAQGGRFDGIMEVPTAAVLGHRDAELIPEIHVLHRGDLTRPEDRVTPSLPAVFGGFARTMEMSGGTAPQRDRKALALWLTRPDHPMTARVIVNRIWQWHFGNGLVRTPNDFGRRGVLPSHLALLDWLAVEFVERSWSIKDLHRLIMLSETYRLSSCYTEKKNAELDPDNHFLWRMNRRRLEAEALWDAIHTVAGTINLKMGGRPVVPPLADDEMASLRKTWHWPVTRDPSDYTRRGIYLINRRNFLFPMFVAFDAPETSISCARRDVTTVTSQALWCLNNKTVFEQSVAFAARLVNETGSNEEEGWVERAWTIALGRPPTANEMTEAVELLDTLRTDEDEGAGSDMPELPDLLGELSGARARALVQLCLAVFNLNEFTYID